MKIDSTGIVLKLISPGAVPLFPITLHLTPPLLPREGSFPGLKIIGSKERA